MSAALVGLAGTVVGALAATGGTLMSGLLQSRRERFAFTRTRKADAYAAAVEHLFRAAVRRSEFTADGRPLLGKEDQREWFLDLAAALQALTAAAAYAAPGWRDELATVLQRYGQAVWKVTQKGLDLPKSPLSGAVGPSEFRGYKDEESWWSGDVIQTAWVAAQRVQEIATWDLAGYESRQAAVTALRKGKLTPPSGQFR